MVRVFLQDLAASAVKSRVFKCKSAQYRRKAVAQACCDADKPPKNDTSAQKAQYREKLVAIVRRRECVYKRAGELSVTFHERGGTTERVTDFSL